MRKIVAIREVKYIEPAEYIPRHIREELGLGEYAKNKNGDACAPTKEPDAENATSDASEEKDEAATK